MLNSHSISRLYTSVLYEDITLHNISTEKIREGIRCMGKAYSVECANFSSDFRDFPDYNHPAFRCAYLHKYAPLHTYIVIDAMLEILRTRNIFHQCLYDFRLCCLGGGPGNDVIGVLAALYSVFGIFKVKATVIDYKKEWEITFKSIIEELRFGEYGEIWRKIEENLEWRFLGANLLDKMTNDVNKVIAESSFVTMVKFVSAASCTIAENMLEKIFRVMKPGALLLFIDNAAGGFTQAVERASKKSSFETVMPARRHVHYDNENFKAERFGHESCFKTIVTILLLRKPVGLYQKPYLPNANINFTPHLPQSANSCKLTTKKENLNHNINSSNSLKIIIERDTYDQKDKQKKKSNFKSCKSPIEENNLNISNEQKLSIQNKNIPATSQSKSSTRKVNTLKIIIESDKPSNSVERNIPKSIKHPSQGENSSFLNQKVSINEPPQHPPCKSKSPVRKSNSNLVSNKPVYNNVPSSSPRASARSIREFHTTSTSEYFPTSSPKRHSNRRIDDIEDTGCCCCVIS